MYAQHKVIKPLALKSNEFFSLIKQSKIMDVPFFGAD